MTNFISQDIGSLFANEETFDVLASIVSCIEYAIIMSKVNGQFAIWNNKATEILGKQESNIGIEQWASHYGCHHLDGTPMNYKELPLVEALFGKQVSQKEIIIKYKGKEKYIMCDANPIMHAGNIIGGVIMFRETTNERNLEHKMQNMLKNLDDLKESQIKILERIS